MACALLAGMKTTTTTKKTAWVAWRLHHWSTESLVSEVSTLSEHQLALIRASYAVGYGDDEIGACLAAWDAVEARKAVD